jgi:hypothetical protein
VLGDAPEATVRFRVSAKAAEEVPAWR